MCRPEGRRYRPNQGATLCWLEFQAERFDFVRTQIKLYRAVSNLEFLIPLLEEVHLARRGEARIRLDLDAAAGATCRVADSQDHISRWTLTPGASASRSARCEY